jgi:hypothetical protein
MADYALTADPNVILRTADQAHIPVDETNADYQAYLAWLEAGNTPDAYVPPPPVEADPVELPAHPVDPMDAATKQYVDETVAAAAATLSARIATLEKKRKR